MKKFMVTIVLLVIAVVMLTSTPDGSTASEVSPTTTPSATFHSENVAQADDCEELQVIFDASWAAHQSLSDEEVKDLDKMQMHSSVMEQANDRLDELGCS